MKKHVRFLITIAQEYRRIAVDVEALREQVAAMLFCMGWRKAAVNIRLVSDRRIRVLNRDYLGHDRPTDVIAFSQLEGDGWIPDLDGCLLLGDLVISTQTARRQAVEYGNTFNYELAFYICHGLLHLAGFDDATSAERNRMHRIQTETLRRIGLEGDA